MRRGRFGAVAVVVVSLGLGGCTGEAEPGPQTIGPESSTSATESGSGSSSAAAPSTAVTTAPKPAQTFPPEQQPIVEVYWAYYDALYALRTQSDDAVRAALSPYAISYVVEFVVKTFAGYRARGEEPQGAPVFGTLEVAVDGQTAVIRECRDSSTESIIKVDTGEVIDYGSAGTLAQTNLAVQPDGNWAVTETYATGGGC